MNDSSVLYPKEKSLSVQNHDTNEEAMLAQMEEEIVVAYD